MERKAGNAAWSWMVSAALAAALIALGFLFVRHAQDASLKRSQTLTVAAQAALDRSDFESAARYALAAMQGKDWPLVGFDAHKAEIVLAGAVAYSPALPGGLHFDCGVGSVAYSADGTILAVTLTGGNLQLWAVSNHRLLASVPFDAGYAEHPSFSPDNRTLKIADRAWALTPSKDGTIQMTDLPAAPTPSPASKIVKALEDAADRSNYEFPDTYLATSPDGSAVLSAKGHHLHLWNTRTGQVTDIIPSPYIELDSDFDQAVYSPSGRLIALRAGDSVVILDAKTMKLNGAVLRSDQSVQLTRFSSDDESLAVVNDLTALQVYDTHNLDPQGQVMRQIGLVSDADFSPDGETIAVAGGDGLVRFWRVKTGMPTRKIQLPRFESRSDVVNLDAWIARDDKTIAIMDYNKDKGTHVSLWDIAQGTMIGLPLAERSDARIAGISDDNALYISANSLSLLSLIDTRTHAVLRQGIPAAPEDCGYRIAMSSDHRYLACSRVTDFALFDLKGAGHWQTLAIPAGGLAFTSDSKSLRAYDPDNGDLTTFVDLATLKRVKRPEPAHEQANAPLIFNGTVTVAAGHDSPSYVDVKTGHRIGPERQVDWGTGNVAANQAQVHIIDFDHALTTYRVDPAIGLRGKALKDLACNKILPGDLSMFRDDELEQTPLLDPKRDRNACSR